MECNARFVRCRSDQKYWEAVMEVAKGALSLILMTVSVPALGAVTFCSDLSSESIAQIESALFVERPFTQPIYELERDELDELVHRSLDDESLTVPTRNRLLVSASQLGLLLSVRKLLSKPIPVDWRDDSEEFSVTALFVAAWCGHSQVVRELLRAGASPIQESCLPFGGSGARVCTYPLYAAIAGSEFEGGCPIILRDMRGALIEKAFPWRSVRDGANLTGVDYLKLADPTKRDQLAQALDFSKH